MVGKHPSSLRYFLHIKVVQDSDECVIEMLFMCVFKLFDPVSHPDLPMVELAIEQSKYVAVITLRTS